MFQIILILAFQSTIFVFIHRKICLITLLYVNLFRYQYFLVERFTEATNPSGKKVEKRKERKLISSMWPMVDPAEEERKGKVKGLAYSSAVIVFPHFTQISDRRA